MPDPTQPVGELPIKVSQLLAHTTAIHVGGEVDLLTTPALDSEITSRLSAPDTRTLVLDLSKVSFFGSSGLAALVRANQTAQERGVRLLLVATSRVVLRPLEVTNTADQFTIHETLDAALADCD